METAIQEPPIGHDWQAIVANDFGPGPMADTDRKRLLYQSLRVRMMLENEATTIKANALAMVEDAEKRLAEFDAAYASILTQLVQTELAGGKAKSLKTPFGQVGFRKQPAQLHVVSEDLVAREAFESADLTMRLFKTVTSLSKSALNAYWKETGNVLPGCEVEPEHDAFFVSHKVKD